MSIENIFQNVHSLIYILLKHFDLYEDTKTIAFIPPSTIDHIITHTIVKEHSSDASTKPKIKKERQVRAKVFWKSGEVSWASAISSQVSTSSSTC